MLYPSIRIGLQRLYKSHTRSPVAHLVGPLCGSVLATAIYVGMFQKWDDGDKATVPTELKDSMKQYTDEDTA